MSDLINPQTFEMLMDRFDRVDREMGELKGLVNKQSEEGRVYYAVTTRHKQYFKILWASLAGVGGTILTAFSTIGTDVLKRLFH
jgi:hypothetical protein